MITVTAVKVINYIVITLVSHVHECKFGTMKCTAQTKQCTKSDAQKSIDFVNVVMGKVPCIQRFQ